MSVAAQGGSSKPRVIEEEHAEKILKQWQEQLKQERIEKITQMETFINERLKPDLQRVLQQRENAYQSLSGYLELRNNILLLKENQLTKLKTMVNLGCECYVQAKVSDTRKLFVDIGLGFHVQLDWDEALEFINMKEKQLTNLCDQLTKQAFSIQTRIRMMYEALTELKAL